MSSHNALTIVGALDPHVHLRDLDWSDKGTFYTETAAAIAGGYWAVLDMPNTAPSTIHPRLLKQKLSAIRNAAISDWGLYFGAAQEGNWKYHAEVVDKVCGLKIYNNATTGNLLIDDQALREEHYRHWPPEKVIAVHAEEDTILEILDLVRRYGKHTHFCHISSAYEIDLLRAAKAEDLPISIGVTPHHLYLTQDDLPRLGAFGLMKPELKTKTDQEALWEAIADGLVDVIESDHAPHARYEKESDNPPYGVPGLETTLPLMYTAVKQGRLTAERMIEMVSTNPQRIFGITPPPDTYTVFDTTAEYTLNGSRMQTHCRWTPFEGMTVYGRVQEVWIRGNKVLENGSLKVRAGYGKGLFETWS